MSQPDFCSSSWLWWLSLFHFVVQTTNRQRRRLKWSLRASGAFVSASRKHSRRRIFAVRRWTRRVLKPCRPASPMPLDLAKISFQISDRGCSLLLPMEAARKHLRVWSAHGTFRHDAVKWRSTGRRVFLKPTDKPENDLGESHAPVPFYVSTEGYGVFVDTARFASFYTGDVSPVRDAAETGGGGVQTSTTELYRAAGATGENDARGCAGRQGSGCLCVCRADDARCGGTLQSFFRRRRDAAVVGIGRAISRLCQISARRKPSPWPAASARRTCLAMSGASSRAGSPRRIPVRSSGTPTNFPIRTIFCGKCARWDYKMNFWEHAFTHPSSPIYDELKPWSGNYLVWNGLVPDFASPQARKIFLKQNELGAVRPARRGRETG